MTSQKRLAAPVSNVMYILVFVLNFFFFRNLKNVCVHHVISNLCNLLFSFF